MSVLAAGQELPDIAWVSERMVPQFMANDILADVTDIVQDEAFDIDDIIPSTLELFRQDDKLYGLPFSTPPSVVFYNEDLFKQAGLSTPNELAEKENGRGKSSKKPQNDQDERCFTERLRG